MLEQRSSISSAEAKRILFERIAYISLFDFELIVDARRKIVENDHFAVRREAILLFDANPDQSFNRSTPSDSTHAWRSNRILIVRYFKYKINIKSNEKSQSSKCAIIRQTVFLSFFFRFFPTRNDMMYHLLSLSLGDVGRIWFRKKW